MAPVGALDSALGAVTTLPGQLGGWAGGLFGGGGEGEAPEDFSPFLSEGFWSDFLDYVPGSSDEALTEAPLINDLTRTLSKIAPVAAAARGFNGGSGGFDLGVFMTESTLEDTKCKDEDEEIDLNIDVAGACEAECTKKAEKKGYKKGYCCSYDGEGGCTLSSNGKTKTKDKKGYTAFVFEPRKHDELDEGWIHGGCGVKGLNLLMKPKYFQSGECGAGWYCNDKAGGSPGGPSGNKGQCNSKKCAYVVGGGGGEEDPPPSKSSSHLPSPLSAGVRSLSSQAVASWTSPTSRRAATPWSSSKTDPRAAPGTARMTKLGEHERVSVNVAP